MTAQRHRAAAIMLRSRYRLVSSGKVALDTSPMWGWEIWPVLAADHDRRAARIEMELAATAKLPAIAERGC
jgi:hypothetical protein